jgi:hypothetical protein
MCRCVSEPVRRLNGGYANPYHSSARSVGGQKQLLYAVS